MAKRADSVVGIDLGKHVLKGVALRRKGDDRFVLTSFASRPVPEEFASAEDLSRELKQLVRELGGSAKACAFAVSDPTNILRIIEQPDTTTLIEPGWRAEVADNEVLLISREPER